MWLGFCAGAFCALTASNDGQPPILACTFGPFKEGVLHYQGKPLHVWMLAAPCALLSLVIGSYDFAMFSAVMAIRGALQKEEPEEEEPTDCTASES